MTSIIGIGQRRGWQLLLSCLVLLATTPGCFLGVSSNPFRFGNPPANDVIRTHAKPMLRGYYHNFDPAACSLKVTPIEDFNQVGTQHVLVATVCDKDGKALRNRRIEWHVSGVGHIVEVDESGFFPGRGYLVDDKYAVSFTNYRKHTITRGTDDPQDDIELLPGQSWCVLTSAEEGDTHVTVHAPGIYNWEKHKVFVTKHWLNAIPIFPQSAVNAAGQPHTLTTRIIGALDRQPVSGYHVRYRILDGPPAVLDPAGAAQVGAVTDVHGNASTVLRQLQPVPGVNRIAIDVVRPRDKPTGKELIIASQIVHKTWVAPQLSIQKVAPPTAYVGQQIPYQITVVNTGSTQTRGVTIRDTLPEGLNLLSTQPVASQQGRNLYWSFSALQPQQAIVVQLVCQATAAGVITNCAEAALAEGAAAKACARTEVVAASLSLSKSGPTTAVVGQPITFPVTVTNQGQAPAANVVVTDTFDAGFVHQSGVGPVQMALGNLAPGQSRSVQIALTPQVAGRLCNRVQATAEGGLSASAEHCVVVTQPSLEIAKQGPAFAFVGAPVEFTITVKNAGPIEAENVVVIDRLPAQLQPQQASDGGVIQGNTVTWNLGTLQRAQQRTLQLLTLANQNGENVCNTAIVTANGGINLPSEPACLNIRGVPALLTELIDRFDPVPVGGETTYTIQITNQGSVPANEVALVCKLPDGLQFVGAEGAPAFKYDEQTQTVTFEPFREPSGGGMSPRKRLRYQVQAKAVKPGDHRFEARITARELKSDIVIQESTTVYDPETGATNGSAARAGENPAGTHFAADVEQPEPVTIQTSANEVSEGRALKAPEHESVDASDEEELPPRVSPLLPVVPAEEPEIEAISTVPQRGGAAAKAVESGEERAESRTANRRLQQRPSSCLPSMSF